MTSLICLALLGWIFAALRNTFTLVIVPELSISITGSEPSYRKHCVPESVALRARGYHHALEHIGYIESNAEGRSGSFFVNSNMLTFLGSSSPL